MTAVASAVAIVAVAFVAVASAVAFAAAVASAIAAAAIAAAAVVPAPAVVPAIAAGHRTTLSTLTSGIRSAAAITLEASLLSRLSPLERRRAGRVVELLQRHGVSSLPHVFIGGRSVGGLYSGNATIVNPLLYSQLWSLLGRPKGKQAPSTGLLAVALALGACDSVTLYGFSRAGDDRRCSHHYWDCPKWAEKYEYLDPQHKFHDWLAEAALRKRWLDRGVVVDGASAYGAGAAGAAAVREKQRELAEQSDALEAKGGGRRSRGRRADR